MSQVFIDIYEWFERHKVVFYTILLSSVLICGLMASRLSFQENITNFFQGSDEKKNAVFETVEAKDKIIVMFTGEDPDTLITAADIFVESVTPLIDEGLVSSITAHADEETISRVTSFIYDYLPIFLTDEDYDRIETILSKDGIEKAIHNVYQLLTSPSGMIVGEVVMKDPLNIGTHLLQQFERFNPDLQYEIYDGRLFTENLSTMLLFIQPSNGMGDTGENDRLVSIIEKAKESAALDGVEIDYIGGPIVAVYNARQIKKDTAITLGIAMIFIFFVIFVSFRNKWSILLIAVPPAFGALFALAMVWLVQGDISAISIGAGAVVLGISLSYSIHIVSHLNHTSSPKEVIRELTMPLTIGCFTTIGAFAALIFTSSALLRDMGLFSVFALIGTTMFCLVFMPQFIGKYRVVKETGLLQRIENVLGYNYEGNQWIVLPIFVVFLCALFFYQNVKFDDDMSNLNYMPVHISEAEERSKEIFGDESNDVYMVTGSPEFQKLTDEYSVLYSKLQGYQQSGIVSNIVTVRDFVVSEEEQVKRIDRWNRFWKERRTDVLSQIELSAQRIGFRAHAFSQLEEMLNKTYTPCFYSIDEIGEVPVISEWVNTSSDYVSLLTRITLKEDSKPMVYAALDSLPNTAVIDRGYFSSKMVETTSADFNYILWVSSLIVFLALLLSYGRIELTLLTFLPMAISWVIILGLMTIFGIKFNIVNIILATLIFGIGDDFSIFIMDGLLQEYKNGKKVLGAHKTAIFFSAFTAIVGMGVLIFAQHPALKSIALISVLGLSVVVLVSYTIQPMLFKWLVTSQTNKGGFPYTFGSILNTLYCFLYFLLGCIVLQLFMLILILCPIRRSSKKLAFHRMTYWLVRIFLHSMITVRIIRKKPHDEKYDKPAVIIANHQSFIDILLLLSITPKVVMVTKSWVWNSPFFGWIVKYADFHHSADGYEALAERLRERIAEGYSVVVFPEGTRSVDCSIQRFHKGAFYLSQLLKLDILPVMIYGAGQISAKNQGFYIKKGIVSTKTFPRIVYGDISFGETYQEQAKQFRRWYIEQYRLLNEELGRTHNSFYRDALIKNYIYKGPVLEWYMRVKCRLDGYYDWWDRLVPRLGTITDVGCGYGQMSFMLGMLSPERTVLGIDYDNDKIEMVQHSFLAKRGNVRFICADMCKIDLPQSDVFLFNDSLHYVSEEDQRQILTKALASLSDHGMIIVRDGDASQVKTHGKIEQTEVWSTKILNFNKTTTDLCFVSMEWMRSFAASNDMHIRIRRCDKDSSETLYILTKNIDEKV